MTVKNHGRIIATSIGHGVLSQYGDIMAACFNLLNVPIRLFFRNSLQKTYGIENEETYEMIFSICAAVMFIGLMCAFAVMGKLMDELGRKQTVILRSILGIVGSTCMLFSYLLSRFELFVVGHFLAGVLSGLKVVLIIWVAECSPDSKRGLTSLIVNSGSVIMVLSVTPLCLPSIFGTTNLWYYIPVLTTFLAVFHLILCYNCLPSPKQLYIQRNNEQGARQALSFYYGTQNKKEIESALVEMEHERKQANKKNFTVMDILQKSSYRCSLLLVFVCSLVPVFSSLNIKSQYLVGILMSYGLSQSDSTIAMIVISSISLPVCFIAPLIIEKYGRRPIFLTLTWLCCIEWILFSIAQVLNDLGYKMPCRWVVACVGAVLGQTAVNLGMIVMAPIMISEVCPHNIRAKVSQITQVPPIGIAAVEVLAFPTLLNQYGAAFFLFLASCCAALAMILQTRMLETAGLAVDEIVSRLGGERTLTRSNTSVGWLHYGSLWDKEPDRSLIVRTSSKSREIGNDEMLF